MQRRRRQPRRRQALRAVNRHFTRRHMGNFSIALSGLMAQSQALNIVSNNLANLNTTGFKGSSASFQDLVAQAIGGSAPNGGGVSAVMAKKGFSQGSIQITQGAFDAAIEGNGFFVIKNAQGQQF